ncbi:hypothetical protein PRELSG_0102000 [Plasmodium relictum]|uniref:Uncharacterized protein n=1 Tax=Plasmodium relictum TaxID=85471 RepID=A0A1J1H074_PLARL|nr:hypothetical protein PRELSG_0102000 [Plasmodium relictum]CRG98375.1 hypothetical protein PRELSG_0102000 [Plasmodium relictum]
MNIFNAFHFHNLLLNSNMIIFMLNICLLSNIYKDVVLSNNHELGLITKRNVAEAIKEKIELNKENYNDNNLNIDEIIQKYTFSEYCIYIELMNEIFLEKSLIEIENNIERNAAIIYGQFYKNKIVLSFNEVMNVHRRTVNILRIVDSLPEDNGLFKYLPLIVKMVTIESLNNINHETTEREIKVHPSIISNISNLLFNKLEPLNEVINNDQFVTIKYLIMESINDVIDHYNDRFRRPIIIDEQFVLNFFIAEYNALNNIVMYMCSYFDRRREIIPMQHLSKKIIEEIIRAYSKCNIKLTYNQFKTIHYNILERVHYMMSNVLTEEFIRTRFRPYYTLEIRLTIKFSDKKVCELNMEGDGESYDIDFIKSRVVEAFQLENIDISPNEMNNVAYRIYNSIRDIIL